MRRPIQRRVAACTLVFVVGTAAAADLGEVSVTESGPAEVVDALDVPACGTGPAERPDDKHPDKERAVFLFGRPLTVGGYVRPLIRYNGNFDLDNATRDDTFELSARLQLEALYRITPHVLAFVAGRFVYHPTFTLNTGMREDVKEIIRREHFLFAGDVLENVIGPGYSVQIGRQKIEDERQWWWRRPQDAARFHYDRPRVHLELAVAEELAPESTQTRFIAPEDEGVLRTLGNAAWSWQERQRLDFFFLYHFDHSGQHPIGRVLATDHEDPSDARLLWLGTRASGQVGWGALGDLRYGIDGAWLGGNERSFGYRDVDAAHARLSSKTSHDVDGFAVDARGAWLTTLPTRPGFALGYAFGSGNSDAKHGLDTGFRQTGLERNRAPYLGVQQLRYYGELLRPELANLHIFTGSVGYRILRSSSVELLYHFYRQAIPAPFLRSARIKADPTGKSSLIGHEWDVALFLEEWEHFKAQLIPGLFLAGEAYGRFSGNLAEVVFVRLKYAF